MFRRTPMLQFEAKPEKPDAMYTRKLQELIGGAFGEMTVTMQYLFQGWNCRMEGKYKDLIMDTAKEEIGHVEMLATLVARLLEGAPATETAEAADNSAIAAVLGGMDPQQVIVAGGGGLPGNSQGVPWNGAHIIASGNLLADFRTNAAAEAQGRLQTARLYNMTDDPGVKAMLQFNVARDTVHQKQWLAAIEELQADGIEETPIVPNALLDEEDQTHNNTIWHLSDGPDGRKGGWNSGEDAIEYLMNPEPLGGPGTAARAESCSVRDVRSERQEHRESQIKKGCPSRQIHPQALAGGRINEPRLSGGSRRKPLSGRTSVMCRLRTSPTRQSKNRPM